MLRITPPYGPWNLTLAKKLLVNDKITASCSTNILPKRHIQLYKQQKWTLKKGKARGVASFSTRVVVCLVPRRLKYGKRKTRLHEPSTSIMQWTMGTFGVDVKDAGNGEREKCLSHDTQRGTKIPVALESARTRLDTRQTSCRPGWLSFPHILKIAWMTHWPQQHLELLSFLPHPNNA